MLGTINVYYDYALNDNFKLYTCAGLGICKWEAREKLQNRTEPWESITKPAYQLMAGISYDINENWTFKTGYRFSDLFTKGSPHTHILEAGIRYNF